MALLLNERLEMICTVSEYRDKFTILSHHYIRTMKIKHVMDNFCTFYSAEGAKKKRKKNSFEASQAQGVLLK